MEHHTTTSRAEAERLLGIAEKLLRNKDYSGCKDFAMLAQETEPLLEGSDQILAVAEVLLASTRKINNHQDWYSILQIATRTEDPEQIKKQYRRLALLLHPDKNKYAFADNAFGLVADAWAVLSDPTKKALYDNEMSLYTKVDLVPTKKPAAKRHPAAAAARRSDDQGQKLPVRRSSRVSGNSNNENNENNNNSNSNFNNSNSAVNNQRNMNPRSGGGVSSAKSHRSTFWSVCPYCYNLYEYERAYLGCCLRCENCERAFTAAEIRQMPPRVPGKNAYYCCWGFFPMGFVMGNTDGKRSITTSAAATSGFPNWMPPMFSGGGGAPTPTAVGPGGAAPAAVGPGGGTPGVNGDGFVSVAEGNVGTNVTVMGIAAEGAMPTPKPKPKPTPQPVSGGPRKRGRPRKNPL